MHIDKGLHLNRLSVVKLWNRWRTLTRSLLTSDKQRGTIHMKPRIFSIQDWTRMRVINKEIIPRVIYRVKLRVKIIDADYSSSLIGKLSAVVIRFRFIRAISNLYISSVYSTHHCNSYIIRITSPVGCFMEVERRCIQPNPECWHSFVHLAALAYCS